MKKISYSALLFCFITTLSWAAHQPDYSTAGFYRLKNTGREVFSMNVAWRFYKGAVDGANLKDFDDSKWKVVSLPHGIEYLPTEASGCVNYQGEVWYRKHFRPDDQLKGKKLFLHFEAIMGKSKVWINGHLLTEHFGGFLPVIADISNHLKWGEDNVITVLADNSNDPSYPPGKAQNVLDFSYFGGIYRDCWLVAHNHVFITDPNYENEVAGGGLFVAYDNVSDKQADVLLKIHLRNENEKPFGGKVEYELCESDNTPVATLEERIKIGAGSSAGATGKIILEKPKLWSPESPYLYHLNVRIKDKNGKVIDGFRKRIGIRSIEFKGQDGFWLNGKPYGQPLIGANRHQDFAVLGNALPNSLHWRDAKKLRDAGLKVIRNAHYPQDPAFMDACDELGLFVIVNTPGWQFWNDDPIFEKRVYSDIRNMVRRDRNHASVWMWEPILNETWYPDYFARNVKDIVDEEYPYPYCYSGCDSEARGNEYFPVLFAHPVNGDKGWAAKHLDPEKTYFTREWGDNVDDWNSQNSPSRVSRAWGEQPMLVQANHYAHPDYPYTSYDALYKTIRQHVGGCLWHSFDHQRGYHPDPFYGGIMDVFRQPKYSYYLFMAQRLPQQSDLIAETGPMVHIAHEMTPFSGKDVTVYSNCDEVHLKVFADGEEYVYKKAVKENGIPNPIIVFQDVYDFMADKAKSRASKQDEVYMQADGYINGEKVATHRVEPARRPEKIVLWADDEAVNLKADGSDCVVVVAGVADKNGHIKRLNNYFIRFEIEGEGELVGDEQVMANPRPVVWGTAPILVKSTTRAGKINVRASVLFEGEQMPLSGELELESFPVEMSSVYSEEELAQKSKSQPGQVSDRSESDRALKKELEVLRKELNDLKLKEVERQQDEFGEKNKSSHPDRKDVDQK